jgi:hypothetical protein
MPGSTKKLALCTLLGLVLVSAYTVGLGADGRLWLGWTALALATAGSALTGGR